MAAYPHKYGALTGRSRLFRTVGVALFDLLLMLVTLATFIDFHAGVAPRLAPIRMGFYLASCFFLCFALICVASLDALESISRLRRENRVSLEQMLRTEIDKARAEHLSRPSGNGNSAARPKRPTIRLMTSKSTPDPSSPSACCRPFVVHGSSGGRCAVDAPRAASGRTGPYPSESNGRRGHCCAGRAESLAKGGIEASARPMPRRWLSRSPGKPRAARRSTSLSNPARTLSASTASRAFPALPAASTLECAAWSRRWRTPTFAWPVVDFSGSARRVSRCVSASRERHARQLIAAYIHHRRTSLPLITHKTAMTMDGVIALENGDSQWVTGPAARLYAHRRRDRADAIMVGVGTVLSDDPSLTTRLPNGNCRDPFRVVIDSGLRTPTTAKVARPGTLVIAAEGQGGCQSATCPGSCRRGNGARARWRGWPCGCRLGGAASRRSAVSLMSCWNRAGLWRALSGMLDLSAGRCSLSRPKIVGGEKSMTPVGGRGHEFMRNARILGRVTLRRFGPDIALEADAGEK